LRADICAKFFIKVKRDAEAIGRAATTLGNKAVDDKTLKDFANDKLVSTLRSVTAKSTLIELHQNREQFKQDVREIAASDLEENGFELENVSIVKLDQTDYSRIDIKNNIFDAQGAKTIAETTQAALVAKNKIEKLAEVEKESQNLENLQQINEINVKKSESSANAAKEQQNKQALANAEAREFAAEQQRKAQEAEIASGKAVAVQQAKADQETEAARIAKEKAVEAAEFEKQQAVEAARIAKEQAVETADVNKKQTVAVKDAEATKAKEVAAQEAAIAIAVKEKEKAAAEEQKNLALAKAKAAEESVITAQAKAKADREKEVAIINEQAQATKTQVKEQMQVDVEAYKKEKLAQADKTAALNKAEAVRTAAQADADAAKLRAEGLKAEQIVPVEVDQRAVEVEAARVAVLKDRLEAEGKNLEVSVTKAINIAAIQADKEVRVKFAESLGLAFKNVDIQVFGDPNTLETVLANFTAGAGKSAFITGIQTPILPGATKGSIISNDAKALISDYWSGLKTAFEIQGTADNVSTEVKSLISQFAQSSGGGNLAGLLALSRFVKSDASEIEAEKLEKLYKALEAKSAE
jgi:uncharacterized membrane protein YqiK